MSKECNSKKCNSKKCSSNISIKELRLCLEEVNYSLSKSVRETEILFNYFYSHRSDDGALDLLFDSISRLVDDTKAVLDLELSLEKNPNVI